MKHAQTVILIMCLSVSNANAFEVGSRYLNYGYGLINLNHVTYINPEITYTVTLPDQYPEDFFENYKSQDLSLAGISDLLRWFDTTYLQDVPFYFLRIFAKFRLMILN